MATIKSHTDIEQSKKLAEILSIESADLWWAERFEGRVELDGSYIVEDTPYYYLSFTKPSDNNYSQDVVHDIPCWSLAALFKLLPKSAQLEKGGVVELCRVTLPIELESSNWYVEPIDACYEMIMKLHELNLIEITGI